PQDKMLALFVGRFVPKKGFAKLLRLQPIENLDIVYAGGHAPIGFLRADHHFLGPVSRLDMPDVFKMCDIFILPSQGEGFPVTVQEAMASGLPVVTTDDPAYQPYSLNSKLIDLINPSVDSIDATLKNLVLNHKKRQLMSKYSREFAVECFDST